MGRVRCRRLRMLWKGWRRGWERLRNRCRALMGDSSWWTGAFSDCSLLDAFVHFADSSAHACSGSSPNPTPSSRISQLIIRISSTLSTSNNPIYNKWDHLLLLCCSSSNRMVLLLRRTLVHLQPRPLESLLLDLVRRPECRYSNSNNMPLSKLSR